MAKKCFKNTPTDPNSIPVDSVIWTGDDIECLNICNGEAITELMFAVATRVCQLMEITNVENITLCDKFIAALGTQDKVIANLLQILFDESCSLREFIEQVEKDTKTSIGLTLDFKCISTQIDPCTPTNLENLSQVLQVIINAFCDLKNQFDNLVDSIGDLIDNDITEYLDGLFESDLPNRIIKIVGPTPKYKFRGFVPPNCPIFYTGPMSYFNGSGIGIGPMTGWYLCNGANGTTDMRGVVPVGMLQGMGGGTLPSNVNPSTNPITPSANYSMGDRGGRIGVNLTTSQIPSHSHPIVVNDPGHAHTYTRFYMPSRNANDPNIVWPSGTDGLERDNGADVMTAQRSESTSTNTTGITVNISSTGGGQIHENRMPYVAGAYIQMID